MVNAGSSSLKLRVVGADDGVEAGDDLPAPQHEEERLRAFLDRAGPVDAVAHRVVHGGDRFAEAVVVDDDAYRALRLLDDLAPLHNPAAREGMDVLRGLLPAVPQVACFDTSFHRHLPAAAATYAIPASWRAAGVRRFGFHGLSYAWSAGRAADLLGRTDRRLVICHLGSGASAAAVSAGRSVDTTMGFTPLEGLVMSTRSGDVDPGAVTWVEKHLGLTPAAAERALDQDSGLAALGGSGDMRELLERRRSGDERAAAAIEVYLHRLRAKIASMAAALSGVDALVFTGGVGEHSADIRAEACAGLGWLGVAIDARANREVTGADADISAPGAAATTLVVHAREEIQAARETRRLLGSAG